MAKLVKPSKKKISKKNKQLKVKAQPGNIKQPKLKNAVSQKSAAPTWIWILIVIMVAAGGYWLIQLTNQREQVVNSLPAEMSVAEVAKLDPDEWFFLDVREQSEWDEGHIEWATLIPLGQLEARQGELPRDQKIVVVCRSGNRSADGRDILLKAGFEAVTSMAGGMNDWVSLGLRVATGP